MPGGAVRREERAAAVAAAGIVVLLVAGLTVTVAAQRDEPAPRQPLLAAVDQAPQPPPTVAPASPAEEPPAPAPVEVVEPEPEPEPPAEAPAEPVAAEPAPAPAPAPALRARAPPPEPAPPAQPAPTQSTTTQSASAQPQSTVSDSERRFAGEFPAHAQARQRAEDPSSHYWAVIVGVNRYGGRTGNTLGSVADAHVLREELLRRGWRNDHILLLTDGNATHDRIVRGLEWLARSTDERSTVVFSFSGHMKHERGVTALWPADNRFIWAPDFGRMMGAVRAGRVWVALQGCHAEGMRASGLEGPGRVVTYSSKTAEKSYEDPEVGHSVMGWFMFAEGIRDRHADRNGNGRISVQDAWNWATPRAHTRTAGRQTPVISDGFNGRPFYLEVGG